MNQAIQILDGVTYLDKIQRLQIDALHNGQLIACFVYGADEKTLLNLYSQRQFDIEELLESLIEAEEFDSTGAIQVNIAQMT